jgi:hypothetical protein
MIAFINRRAQNLRHGCPLIELLGVSAILGILVALWLPENQKAREAAVVQCQNNPKQIGIARNANYEANTSFPHIGESPTDGSETAFIIHSASTHILPYLENNDRTVHKGAAQNAIPAFHCPTGSIRPSGVDTRGYGYTDYMIIALSNLGDVQFLLPQPGGSTAAQTSTDRAAVRWAEPDNFNGGSGAPDSVFKGKLLNNNARSFGGPDTGDALTDSPAGHWTTPNCGPNDEPFSFQANGCDYRFGDGSVRFLRNVIGRVPQIAALVPQTLSSVGTPTSVLPAIRLHSGFALIELLSVLLPALAEGEVISSDAHPRTKSSNSITANKNATKTVRNRHRCPSGSRQTLGGPGSLGDGMTDHMPVPAANEPDRDGRAPGPAQPVELLGPRCAARCDDWLTRQSRGSEHDDRHQRGLGTGRELPHPTIQRTGSADLLLADCVERESRRRTELVRAGRSDRPRLPSNRSPNDMLFGFQVDGRISLLTDGHAQFTREGIDPLAPRPQLEFPAFLSMV